MFARRPSNPSHVSSGSSNFGGIGFLLLCWAVCSFPVAIPGLRRGKRQGQTAQDQTAQGRIRPCAVRLSCHSRPRKCSLMHQSSHRKCCMVGVSFNRSGQYQCVLTPGQRHPAKRRVLSSTRFPCLWGVPSLGPRQWAAQTPPPAHHTHC